MKRRSGCLRAIIITLLTIIVLIPVAEGYFRYLDPSGAYRYFADEARLIAGIVRSERGYSLYPGLYQFSNWSALILPDSTRDLPDAHSGTCKLAFVGDSLTWGFGVNDSDTFANQIAGQVEAQVVNVAMTGYTSHSVLKSVATYPADGYIYLAIYNDDEPYMEWQSTRPLPYHFDHGGLEVYLFMAKGGKRVKDVTRFKSDLEALRARGDVLIVALDEQVAGWNDRIRAVAPDVLLLPMFTGTVSRFDSHPNAQGHQHIATALRAHVAAFEERVCEEE